MDRSTIARDGVAAPFAPATRPDARIDRLFARYYYGRPDFIDGTALFHRLCRESIGEGAAILEIGAGPSNATSACLATIGPVAGLDVSDEVRMNAHLTSTHVFDGHAFPFEAESYDACVSNYVLEHVADPARHFAEVGRVLKPGGLYCFRTPNIWHYIVLASRCVPHAVHDALANRMRALVDAHDPYPTFYRANTRRTIGQLARSAGLATIALPTVEAEPWYGRSHPLLFYPMMAYERLVNSSARLAGLRANIFGVLRKLPATRSPFSLTQTGS